MAFQLHIRQNLDSARDHFGPGRVHRFESCPVRIGSAADCECTVDTPEFAAYHLVLDAGAERSRTRAVPQEGATTYLNGNLLTAATPLRSGDELRVGHWTLRFQTLHEAAGRNRPFNLMSVLAKGAVAAVLVAEVAVVVWLPKRMHQAAMWQTQIVRHRVADLIDRLRRSNRGSPDTDSDFERSLRRCIGRELQIRAEYVTRYGDQLSALQNRRLYEELQAFDRILQALAGKQLPPPLPVLELDAAVRAMVTDKPGRKPGNG